MNKLTSIKLSNIRRFSANTTIELSTGATILLAPNGTGKTAIFEAIEFGLTGKISRLGDNLSPIIRDTQNAAQVNLSFGETHATSQVNSNGNIVRTGDLTPLFPGTNPDDIPFLLRLTHLLDQREREWLVQAEAKIAGSQLARLPIGRDGSLVKSALGSIRRSLKDQLNQAKLVLASLETKLNGWQSLTRDRDLAVAQSQGTLQNREHISESILDIARRTQCFEQLPKGLLAPPLREESLEAASDALQQLLQAKAVRLRDQVTALSKVDSLIGRFVSERARSEKIKNELTTATEELEQKTNIRTLAITEYQRLQQELIKIESKRSTVAQRLKRYANKANAKKLKDQHSLSFDNAVTALAKAELQVNTLRNEHERNERLGNQHNLVNMQLQASSRLQTELLTAEKLVGHWEQTLQLLKELETSLNDKKVQKYILLEQLQVATSSKTTAEAEELTTKSYHQTLTAATDAIRQAVASIAANLPNDRSDCPLCGEEHGATALHKRVAKALEAIDPNIVDAELRVKMASSALRESVESFATTQANLKLSRNEIADLELQKVELMTQAEGFRNNALLGGETVRLAMESIRRRSDANASNILQLNDQLRSLPIPIAPDTFEQTKSGYDSAVLELNNTRRNHSEATSQLEQATAALTAVTADEASSQTLEELSIEQNDSENHIVDLKSKLRAELSALESKRIELSELSNNVSTLETQLSDSQSHIATLRATWRQLLFIGDPIAEVANSHEAQLHSALSELAQNTKSLETIKIEIGAWKKMEQARVAQGMLDSQRGELTEIQFFENLSQSFKKNQLGVKHLSQLLVAMDSLSEFLSGEIANVHEYVLAVVPRWQSLLKQVIRDQRFSKVNLDFRSTYGKERAKASVLLHGASTAVPSIASEAQLTDLQLTFLLSMALDHQWSSWRGLLLDDPTQHHDMVHAASVFDVLRDYIVDHDFQIVIATHDALQARYFMRKLQNDGIEARLWSLVPTPNGVIAEEGKWPHKKSG